MSVQTKLMTADELLAMPDNGSHQYELVRGELITMSPAGLTHGKVAGQITASLIRYLDQTGLGIVPSSDTGYLLSRNPDTVRQPDASFLRSERVGESDGYVDGAPDLAVEVISPNDRYSDVDAKVREYIAAGAGMVLVVNPRTKTATVTTRRGATLLTIDDSIEGGDVLPGWSLPLRDLFR